MISFLRKSTVQDKMRIVSLPLYMIAPNPNQPRKYFEPQAMEAVSYTQLKVQVGTATKHLNLKMQSRLYLSVTIHLKQTQKLSVLLLMMRAFVIQ